MTEPLDPRCQLDKDAEIRDVGDFATGHVADPVGVGVLLPLVGEQLLHGEGDPLVVRVDGCDHRLDLFTLLDHLAGVVDSTRPRHIGYVHQTVNPRDDLHKGAEIGEVANDSLDGAADAVGLGDLFPWVGFGGPQRQREAALFGVHLRHHNLDFLADLEDRTRVFDLLGP